MADRKLTLKKVIFYILMFGLTFALCFIVLEYAFARFYYSDVLLISDTTLDPVTGWILKPGTYRAKPANTFRKHRVYINEFGLRNRDITGINTEGIERIIILGDSFTYGKACREENTFPVKLGKILNQDPAGRRYEVINAGVPGYGSAQELLFMRKLSEKNIIGDIYILMLFTNDILDNLRLYYADLRENHLQPGFVMDSNEETGLRYLPPRKSVKESKNVIEAEKSLDRTRILKVLEIRIESFLQTKPGLVRFLNSLGLDVKFPCMPGIINGWYRADILDSGLPLTKKIIKEIRDEAERTGSVLLVCFIPSQIQVYPEAYGPLLKSTFPDCKLVDRWLEDNIKPQTIVERLCNELNIPFLDLHTILLQNNGKAFYIPRDGHFNKDGHTIVAHSLADFIRKYDDKKTLIENVESTDKRKAITVSIE